jgi:hypothetical protein
MLDMCKKYDKDGNGTIEFDEFLEMSKVRTAQQLSFVTRLLLSPPAAQHACVAAVVELVLPTRHVVGKENVM